MNKKGKKSDSDKVEALYDMYRQPLFSVAFSILKDTQLAEDTIQITFYQLIKNIDKIEDDVNSLRTKGYLYVIARNVAKNLYNRRNKEYDALKLYSENQSNNSDDFLMDEIFANTSIGSETEEYIFLMKEEDREIINMYYGKELSLEEISQILNISYSAAGQRLSRVRKRLADIIMAHKGGNKGA